MRNRRVIAPAVVLVAVALLSVFGRAVHAQQPKLADVLAKAADAVAPFADTTRVLVCQEAYKQQLFRMRQGSAPSNTIGHDVNYAEWVPMDSRDWVAEIVVAATPGRQDAGFPWMEFRDVTAVAGKTVRDGKSRLGMLATRPFDVVGPQAVNISASAADYMLGRVVRVVDLPRMALLFLHPANQPRFEFKKGGEKTIDGVKAWEVRFREQTKPSLIRGDAGHEAPSTGSFWIDPQTGHVVMAVFRSADSSTMYVETTITYRADSTLGLWLPSDLKEMVMDQDYGYKVEATGAFSNWHGVARTAK